MTQHLYKDVAVQPVFGRQPSVEDSTSSPVGQLLHQRS